MLDLDGFKYVNDSFGHPTGDQLLVDVAQRLRSTVPPGAVAVRLGGDEFAVLLEDMTPAEARQQADEILDALRSPYLVGSRELFSSASVGLLITEPSQRPAGSSACLRDVDQALYAAKAAGKNRVLEFHPNLGAEHLDQARISTGLRYALSHDELLLHYQPIVALRSGGITAAEALVRWQPAHAEPVPPAEFIPVAEQSGLIIDIGAWVLRQACRDACSWYAEYGIAVGVNVSGRQLDDPSFADVVLDALSTAGLPGAALILELTEGSLIATTTDLAVYAQFDRLRERGVRIAIDDFGTGYSSLSYISRLPVDIVKIDSSFTQHCADRGFPGETLDFLRAILHLVSSLKLRAVAEGIETKEQADALRELNCPLAQGHYFSRPVPADRIPQLLSAWAPTTREAALGARPT
jgi:diguanylate cyclase (GGDEF)-like protein